MKQNKRYISITKMSDTSITVIDHGMYLTVLYEVLQLIWFRFLKLLKNQPFNLKVRGLYVFFC